MITQIKASLSADRRCQNVHAVAACRTGTRRHLETPTQGSSGAPVQGRLSSAGGTCCHGVAVRVGLDAMARPAFASANCGCEYVACVLEAGRSRPALRQKDVVARSVKKRGEVSIPSDLGVCGRMYHRRIEDNHVTLVHAYPCCRQPTSMNSQLDNFLVAVDAWDDANQSSQWDHMGVHALGRTGGR